MRRERCRQVHADQAARGGAPARQLRGRDPDRRQAGGVPFNERRRAGRHRHHPPGTRALPGDVGRREPVPRRAADPPRSHRLGPGLCTFRRHARRMRHHARSGSPRRRPRRRAAATGRDCTRDPATAAGAGARRAHGGAGATRDRGAARARAPAPGPGRRVRVHLAQARRGLRGGGPDHSASRRLRRGHARGGRDQRRRGDSPDGGPPHRGLLPPPPVGAGPDTAFAPRPRRCPAAGQHRCACSESTSRSAPARYSGSAG